VYWFDMSRTSSAGYRLERGPGIQLVGPTPDLTSDRDGFLWANGELGLYRLHPDATSSAGATAERITGLPSGRIRFVSAVSETRVFASHADPMVTADVVYHYDGQTWGPEFTPDFVAGLGGDDFTMVALEHLTVDLRNESTGRWASLAGADFPPLNGALNGVAGLGSARFVAVSSAGDILIRAGDRWCPSIPVTDTSSVPVRSFDLRNIVASPSGHVALAFGRPTAAPAVLIRIEAPP
jgi:hypothetical protein